MSGIYFLLKDNIVVYVGQSLNVYRRILEHKRKDFDSFRVIACDECKLLEYERRWIKRFNPIYNLPTGGAREGAGRHAKEPTIVMRIPISLVDAVKEIIRS